MGTVDVRSEIIDALFDGHSGADWLGAVSTLSELPERFHGDYIPLVIGAHRLLLRFDKHFVYSDDLSVYSYANTLLKTVDGNVFPLAQHHRFTGISVVDTTNHEIVPMCAADVSDIIGDKARFGKILYAAIERYNLENPTVTQFIFGGDDIAGIVRHIEQTTHAATSSGLQVDMLTDLAKPYYAFEVTRPHPQAS